MRRSFLAGIVALTATIGTIAMNAAAPRAQTPVLDRLMHDKLVHSQGILAAVVTSDWKTLERESQAIQQLTREPAWAVLMTPEYVRHTGAFVHALDDLLAAARSHDLDAAPLAYASLTVSCVQCHRYVARARIAR